MRLIQKANISLEQEARKPWVDTEPLKATIMDHAFMAWRSAWP
ncbi:MAG: hypothetical protein NTY19_37335 [Planctomycetota bacterium]|nr:hypothetical protein [Planctomycetota bacterium]